MFCRAGFAFSAKNPGTLSLRPGDVIQLMRLRKGWAKGRKLSDDTQGWAPLGYLDVIPKKDVDKAWEVLSEEESSSEGTGSEGSGESEYSEEESGSGSGSEQESGARAAGRRAAPRQDAALGSAGGQQSQQPKPAQVVYALDPTAELGLLEKRVQELEARALAAEAESRELRAALARLGSAGPSSPPPRAPDAEAVLALVDQGLREQGEDALRSEILSAVEAAARPASAPTGLLQRLEQQNAEISRLRALLGAQAALPGDLTLAGLMEQASVLKRENLALSQRLGELQTAALVSRAPLTGVEFLRRRREDLALHD